jgi:hypothetical protein
MAASASRARSGQWRDTRAALFPQFNIETFRIDFGLALQGPVPTLFTDRFSSTFRQVFDFRPDFLHSPL